MRPHRNPGEYVFTVVDGEIPAGVSPIATVVEDEGRALVLRREETDRVGLPYDYVSPSRLGVTSSPITVLAGGVRVPGLPC
jgi:hypothetical protein